MQDESLHTVNAAAVVLAAAARSSTGLRHNHHHQQQQQLHDHAAASAATKKRWWSWLTKANLACFRPHGGHPHRIAAGDTSPQPADAHGTTTSEAYVHHAPPVHPVFAFVAPPSSPASSLFASESPSPVQGVLFGLNAGTSPSPSRGVFAVGPYAHGPQQVVSPPVLYSTLTTEPSTAPRTPLGTTNPSSPEVPFARFLGASFSSSSMAVGGEAGSLFHAYPGSPSPLLSPGSSSPQLFRKLHRRNEGSLLDGHIPMATGGFDFSVPETARSEDHGGSQRDDSDEIDDGEEIPKSGEFVFGNADGGGPAPAEDMDGKNWHFFPMVEQGMI